MPEPQDEIILDGARLRRALRRQSLLWLWLGPLAAGLLFLALGVFVPRTYTGTTSVALQQSSGSSPLAQLTGGGGSKRYLGVLKSRDLATAVERHMELQQVYGVKTLPTEEAAVSLLMNSVKPEDNPADGLLYIAVALPGPPKLALHPSPNVPQVEAAAADAANDYALALKEYFATSDTDQGAALLHGADREVREARARYQDALGQSLDFTRGLSRVDPRSLPASASASAGQAAGGDDSSAPSSSASVSSAPGRGVDSETAASGLAGLYVALNQVQAELSEAEAVRATGQALIGTQLTDLSKVPTDDPLLSDIRSRVAQDRTAYNTLAALYPPGSQNVNLVAAKARLDYDQADYQQQIEGVKQRLTTPDVRSAEQITGLQARQAKLAAQIAQAQRHLGISRQLSGEAGRLQTEVGIQLAVLQTTLSEAAKIRLDNASSLNRMSVIDTALPPRSGTPGTAALASACLALAIAGFLIGIIVDYFRLAPKHPATALAPGGANGSGTMSLEDKDAALPAAQK